MATEIIPVELDTETLDRLRARGRETDEDEAHLIQRLIDEGIRIERHPRIVFRDGPVGRRPALCDGPDVWEIMSAVRDVESLDLDGIEAIAAWLDLPPHWIEAAMGYYAEYPEEVDFWIDRNKRMAIEMEAKWRAERSAERTSA
jgi:hypothetical protein